LVRHTELFGLDQPNRCISYLAGRSKLFAFCYRAYIVWLLSEAKDWPRLKEYKQYLRLRPELERRFPRRYDLVAKVEPDHVEFNIHLLPNKWLMKQWRSGQKVRQLCSFPWRLSICKLTGRPWWDNLSIQLGVFAQIGIRWDYGKRKYFAVSLWLYDHRQVHEEKGRPTGQFEFFHELYEVDYNRQWMVSKWWWGSGALLRSASFHHISPLYRRFGKLYLPTIRGWRKVGTDLSAEAKQELYYKYCDQAKGKGWKAEEARMHLDIALGRPRNQWLELRPVRCIDCDVWHNPFRNDFPEWLRCEDCTSKYWSAGEADVA